MYSGAYYASKQKRSRKFAQRQVLHKTSMISKMSF